jgi:signal transduction histidine kinase
MALTLALLLLLAMLAALAWGWWQQLQMAAQLRDARTRLASLDDLLDVWQWQTDSDHRLTALRPPQTSSSSEWSSATLGVPLWEHFQAEDAAALRARLDGKAPLDDIEGRRGTAAGAPCPARLRGRIRTDALGAFAGYHGTLRDIGPATPPAARLTAATAADTLTPVARASATVSASAPPPTPAAAPTAAHVQTEHESFSYTVSHDLRAPIRVVEGFTKIVKEDYGRLLDRVGNDHLDRVLGAAARMNSMIDALLALSKLSSQPLARQPVNLSQLANYVVDDMRRQWPERKITLEIEPGLQTVGDPTLLRVVLENLLGNAWKYTGKNPQAHVWFERHADQPDCFTVRDNGAGFDMRFADRLFGVFQRLHSANDFPGTGVGLASVQRIVRRHGGTIWGEAEVNRGARFHFSLPPDEARVTA